jgi:hypothetical protein
MGWQNLDDLMNPVLVRDNPIAASSLGIILIDGDLGMPVRLKYGSTKSFYKCEAGKDNICRLANRS